MTKSAGGVASKSATAAAVLAVCLCLEDNGCVMKDELRKALEVVALRDALAEVGLYLSTRAHIQHDARSGEHYIGGSGSERTVSIAKLMAVSERFGLQGLALTFEGSMEWDDATGGSYSSAVAVFELRWTQGVPVLETPPGLAGATWEKCGPRGNRGGLRLPNGTLLVPEDLVL